MGDFSYYQGLNYVTGYFYLIFDFDALDTYNFVINVYFPLFSLLIEKDLNGLTKIFYIINRLLRQNFSNLMDHLSVNLDLNVELFFTSWCLTFFTTIIQFKKKSQNLDIIMDILIGKGWLGFFRVILVIFEMIEPLVYNLKYEEVIDLFREIVQTDFQNISKPKELFIDFKKKIRKYKHIKKNNILYLAKEYCMIDTKIDTFWHKVKKI